MAERRQNTRFKALGLNTAYGKVIDLSDSGIGVFRKGKPELNIGDIVKLHLSHETFNVEIQAEVVRIDPIGMFRHEIGFRFIDIDEETLTKLWSLTDDACSQYASPRCWVAA